MGDSAGWEKPRREKSRNSKQASVGRSDLRINASLSIRLCLRIVSAFYAQPLPGDGYALPQETDSHSVDPDAVLMKWNEQRSATL